MSDDFATVSVERDGRILSGAGADVADLEATMDRHTPAEAPAKVTTPVVESATEPKPSKGRQRFSDLTAERDAQIQRAATAERERDELRAQMAQRRTDQAPAAVPSPAAAQPVPPAAPLTRAKPTEAEVGAKYESYADFVEDLADWKAEQRMAQMDFDGQVRKYLDNDRQQHVFANTFQQIQTTARQSYPDFDQVLEKGPGADVELAVTATGEPDKPKANARTQAIIASPYAGQLLYTIAKDAGLARSLSRLSDIDFGVALARLVASDAPAAPLASTGGRPSIAPAPYQPVGGRSTTTAVSSSEIPKKAGYDFDKSGYREKRAAERGLKLTR